ncbi:MAG: hypothetical protein CFE35_08615 [Novosphingobium sp. PASSN1]|nr:MAG: hypothetical protein CFE35_08615 [Novosphingobium sp. PASSN1]
MFDLLLIAFALAVPAGFAVLAVRSRSWLTRIALVAVSLLPPTIEFYALIWYRQTFVQLPPGVEAKTRAFTAGICQLQTFVALVVVVIILLIASIRSLGRRGS